MLYVGDDEPRKNLALLHAAELPLPVCHAGLGGEPVDPPAWRGSTPQALVLVHPSVHEGFGLTPLEAMARRACRSSPCATAACEEVCGDAAIYVDAADPRQLEQAVRRLHEDPAHRPPLAARGPRAGRRVLAGRPPRVPTSRPTSARWAGSSLRAPCASRSSEPAASPPRYSGFETAAEQLASRLSARGHEVVVYCRPHVVDRRLREYKGARLVHLPTIRNKYLDTFTHTLLSSRPRRARGCTPTWRCSSSPATARCA